MSTWISRALRRSLPLLTTLATLLAVPLLLAGDCQPVLRASVVAERLTSPIHATAPIGAPHLFLVERSGTIRVLRNGVVFDTPFLDIRSRVGTVGEGGLLSLAFPANYASSGHFYVFYTDLSGASVISRFVRSSTSPFLADETSEKQLLSIVPPGPHHKGGTIAFSPIDGFLYVGLGDGDDRPSARDPNSLLGKMLRLDVSGGATSDYVVPSNNPFAGDDGVRDEIWALGFRNPFRFSFDRVTGDLWIGDVGAAGREEIDFEEAGSGGGRDYGWPTHEGTTCLLPDAEHPCDDPENPSRYTFPVYEYTHADGCSITGGVVSRGGAAFLSGAYVFSDFCSGRVWTLVDGQRADITGSLLPGGFGFGVVAITEGGTGELYISQINTGRVYRIE
jgi:glucose/arabinose dehydrogenase